MRAAEENGRGSVANPCGTDVETLSGTYDDKYDDDEDDDDDDDYYDYCDFSS